SLRRPLRAPRAVARRRILEIGAGPAAQVEGAQDGRRPPTEPEGLRHRVVPARGGVEGAREHLDPGAEREDAAAERVLEVLAAEDAPTSLATSSPLKGLMRPGWPNSVLWGGFAFSIVPVEEVHVSSISSHRPRWSCPRGDAPFMV